jgi:hypothetical protein
VEGSLCPAGQQAYEPAGELVDNSWLLSKLCSELQYALNVYVSCPCPQCLQSMSLSLVSQEHVCLPRCPQSMSLSQCPKSMCLSPASPEHVSVPSVPRACVCFQCPQRMSLSPVCPEHWWTCLNRYIICSLRPVPVCRSLQCMPSLAVQPRCRRQLPQLQHSQHRVKPITNRLLMPGWLH